MLASVQPGLWWLGKCSLAEPDSNEKRDGDTCILTNSPGISWAIFDHNCVSAAGLASLSLHTLVSTYLLTNFISSEIFTCTYRGRTPELKSKTWARFADRLYNERKGMRLEYWNAQSARGWPKSWKNKWGNKAIAEKCPVSHPGNGWWSVWMGCRINKTHWTQQNAAVCTRTQPSFYCVLQRLL